MTAPLYNRDILRLAASIPHHQRLPDPMGTAERRSPTCGSEVAVDIILDKDQRVAAIGLLVRACALGQASAALLAQNVIGLHADELTQVHRQLTQWLAGAGELPRWPGIEVLAPALPYVARHASIRLAFDAADAAAHQARVRTAAKMGAE